MATQQEITASDIPELEQDEYRRIVEVFAGFTPSGTLPDDLNASLPELIRTAYQLDPHKVTFAVIDWIEDDPYAISYLLSASDGRLSLRKGQQADLGNRFRESIANLANQLARLIN